MARSWRGLLKFGAVSGRERGRAMCGAAYQNGTSKRRRFWPERRAMQPLDLPALRWGFLGPACT